MFTTLHDFVYTDGADPNLPTQSTDGNFYGTTILGGSKGIWRGVQDDPCWENYGLA